MFGIFGPLTSVSFRFILGSILEAIWARFGIYFSSFEGSKGMAPRWHQGIIAPRALKKKKKLIFGKMTKSKSMFLGRFKGLEGMGVCGNPWKWSQLRACKIWWTSFIKNTCFVTILLFIFWGKSSFGALGVESPHGGAISYQI